MFYRMARGIVETILLPVLFAAAVIGVLCLLALLCEWIGEWISRKFNK